mgnify:CR=1 FL=1
MGASWTQFRKLKVSFLIISIFSGLFLSNAFADLYINILAVNGTEKTKNKDIVHPLPKELAAEDILDTAGLELDYDVNAGNYFLKGAVQLKPKETKTYKVRVRDIWKIETSQVDEIKSQIDQSVDRLKSTEYYDVAKIKKESLIQRLDYIVTEQSKYADNVDKRVDKFRTYADEFQNIRRDSMSVKYWRAKPSSIDNSKNIIYTIEVENPSKDKARTRTDQYYLPAEVKPEYLADSQGFDIKYDLDRKQSYLTQEIQLKPGEKKVFKISIIDVWNINQVDIENLKDRTQKAFKLLEKTNYGESAKYLVAGIKDNLEKIEASQSVVRDIKDHISAYRTNVKYFESAKKDVEALEELLEAVRENLERSQLKNVLQKIKALRSISEISKAIFGKKPNINNTQKIILGVIIFVAVFSTVHFIIWGNRSKAAKLTEKKTETTETKT